MIKAIFFDLDGVLTTDKTGSLTSSKYLSKQTGYDYKIILENKRKFDSLIDSGEIKTVEVWKSVCKTLNLKFNPNWLHEAYNSTPIDNKMVQYAKGLQNKFHIGIITDNSVERANAIIQKNNWTEVFQTVVISEAIKSTKSDTLIFNVAAQKAKLKPEECIFIDNSQKNIVSANKAGFNGVYFDDEIRDYNNLFKIVASIIGK